MIEQGISQALGEYMIVALSLVMGYIIMWEV